jgi:short subunit dehydrogenase-like uncharacterized protein
MTAKTKWMIYGATGYTGGLIAKKAIELGETPTLAGRNAETVSALAAKLGLPWAAFSVDDIDAVEAALESHTLVLSVAGPFSATANTMMNACIKTKTHYLDVTGEIDVFELAASLGNRATEAGITLLPGVGFDVVPSDCLAAHTAARAKAPTALAIAIKGLGGPSRGTAKTAVESLGSGTMARRGGTITALRPGRLQRNFDLGSGNEPYLGVSWGDVSTAFYSTGIPDIEVYFPAEGPIKAMTNMSRFLGPVMGSGFVQSMLKKQIDKMPAGPTDDERIRDTSILLAEVTDSDGTIFRSLLSAPNGYTLTAESAVQSAIKVLHGESNPGFQTPSTAFGANFGFNLSGCELKDL